MMEILFKKYFWTLNVLVLIIAAYLTATTVNEHLSDRLFAAPQETAVPKRDPNAGVSVKLPGRDDGRDYAAILDNRRVFNADDKAETDAPAEEAPESEEKKEEPTGELEETNLNLVLLGTLIAREPADSLATLQLEGTGKLARVGSELKRDPQDEEALATVVEIHRRHIIMQEGSERRIVKLWSDRKPTPGRPGGPVPAQRPRPYVPPSGPQVSQAGPKKTDYDQGVRKISMYDYEVDRTMLEEQLNDLSAIGTQARIVPNYKNGQYQGFKLIGVRPDSLYRSLGIRSGDIIQRVNGQEINSPNKAIQLFEQLRTQSKIALDIERRGQSRTLNFSIK